MIYHAQMSTLAKLVRLQPRSLVSSFRLQASRTLTASSVTAARFHRPSLIRAASSSWSPVSMRYFSTEPEGTNGRQREPSKSLFFGNVPWDANSEHLREIFSQYGAIHHIQVFPRPQGGHKGCGRVDFRHLEDAITAYQSGQAEPFYLMGRTLFVDYSSKTQGNKNHVLYFSYFTGNEEDIRTTLQEYEDRIDRIIFMAPSAEGHVWDRGHIFFRREDTDIAEEVLNKFDGKMTAKGCRLNLEYALQKRD